MALEEYNIALQWEENYKQCLRQSKEESERDVFLLETHAWHSYAASIANDFEHRFGWSISEGGIMLNDISCDAVGPKGLKRSREPDEVGRFVMKKKQQ